MLDWLGSILMKHLSPTRTLSWKWQCNFELNSSLRQSCGPSTTWDAILGLFEVQHQMHAAIANMRSLVKDHHGDHAALHTPVFSCSIYDDLS
jgi:hypothetical protein